MVGVDDLPTEEESEALFAALRELVKVEGRRDLLYAPILLASPGFFPD